MVVQWWSFTDNYAVIGAGNGGQALAGYISSLGYDVTLYNRTKARIQPIQKQGYIDFYGVIQGRGHLSYVGSDLSMALQDRDIIMVVTTADAHKEIAFKMAPFLRDGQIILLNPGRTFGALEVYNTLKQVNCEADVIVAEANSLIVTSRANSGSVHIKAIKLQVPIAALNAEDTQSVLDKINPLFPQFVAASSFLETSFGNVGALFHPTVALLNKERVFAKETFNFYTEGITPKVVETLDKMDAEVNNIAEILKIKRLTISEWLNSRYGVKFSDLHSMFASVEAYQDIKSPNNLNMRYLFEDIPTGLVTMSSFGVALGVSTDTIDNLIDEGSKILGIDFRKNGRTLKNLGLSENNLFSELEKIIYSESNNRSLIDEL